MLIDFVGTDSLCVKEIDIKNTKKLKWIDLFLTVGICSMVLGHASLYAIFIYWNWSLMVFVSWVLSVVVRPSKLEIQQHTMVFCR